MKFKSYIKPRYKHILLLIVAVAAIYGMGRLYYSLTGGFTEGNITYALPYDPRWDITPVSTQEKVQLEGILAQEFFYLGKGCQSYVFSSKDGKYVLKFFKYQRFRPQAWLDYVAFIPPVNEYRQRKIEKKKRKLDNVFSSWVLAYEELKPETGAVFVHLNKGGNLNPNFVIYDKMGYKHSLNLNNYEFLLQKKAKMLCPSLLEVRDQGDLVKAKKLIDDLFAMILLEYSRGYADNDHALMQNTGVFNGDPIHIDVGQFIKNPIVKDSQVYRQELFSKTWKFRIWLKKYYPELAVYTEDKLRGIIGEKFETMKPELNKASMGRIPNA